MKCSSEFQARGLSVKCFLVRFSKKNLSWTLLVNERFGSNLVWCHVPGTWLPRAGQKLRSQRGFHELDLPPAVFLATAIKVEELWPHSMSRANMSQILDQTFFIALPAWSKNGCQIRKRMYKQIWQPVRHAKIYQNWVRIRQGPATVINMSERWQKFDCRMARILASTWTKDSHHLWK